MTVAVIAAPVSAAQAAPSDDSEALARIIDSSLFASDLAAVGQAASGNPSEVGPATGTVDAALLEALNIDLGALQLPVVGSEGTPGLLQIGELGALSSYASSPTVGSSTASAGVVGENGAVSLDVAEAAGPAANTTVNLTDLLDQLGVDGLTDEIVQEISLELGAVASTTSQTAPADPTSNYVVADGNLVIDSPLVGALATDLRTTITGAGDLVDALVGSEGLIGSTVSALATEINIPLVANLDLSGGTAGVNGLDAALDQAATTLLAEPLVDENGLVSISLADGTIAVNLSQLVSGTDGGLNGLAPNTSVLTTETIGLVTDAIAGALGSVSGKVTETVTEVLNAVEVNIALPIELSLLGGLVPAANGEVLVNGTLGQLAGTTSGEPEITLDLDLLGLPLGTVLNPVVNFLQGALLTPLANGLGPILTAGVDEIAGTVTGVVDPLIGTLDPVLTGVLDEIVEITINEQTRRGVLGDDSLTVNAVSLELLPSTQAVDINLASSTVRVSQVAAELTVTPGTALPGDEVTVAGTNYPPNAEVDVQLLDPDGNPVPGTATTVTTDENGSFTTPITVPADAAPGDYEAEGVSGDVTDTAPLQVQDTPELVVTPDTALPGDTVTVGGTGYPPNAEVDVQLLDPEGNPVPGTATTVTTDENGDFETSLTVPEGTEPGAYEAEGVSGDFSDTAPLQVQDANTADNTADNTGDNTEVNAADNTADNTEVNAADNTADNTEVN
ncbi:choice-of-anchor G family protein, partial [Citricoccus sp.]|uniref:choice-of-anchor G family protein n=1 Tax=Citricoccus sp. TaxID=1978372 RepID=UPI0028BDC672